MVPKDRIDWLLLASRMLLWLHAKLMTLAGTVASGSDSLLCRAEHIFYGKIRRDQGYREEHWL